MAQYSVDNRFYRAEIICLDSDSDDISIKAGVRFVDYGSFEYVPHDRYDLFCAQAVLNLRVSIIIIITIFIARTNSRKLGSEALV